MRWNCGAIVRGLSRTSSTVVSEAKGMVAEGAVVVKIFVGCHADLQLVLGPRVGDYLPVVDTAGKALVC